MSAEPKIGIIGCTGFVGQNMEERFDQLGVNYVSTSLSEGMDARKAEDVEEWITNAGVDVVVNLAAECGGIGKNKRCPADLWLAATEISAGVLKGSVRAGLDRLIMLGTVCSYAAECPTPFTEDSLMHHGPPEPTNRAYGLAKLSGLYGAQAFAKQHNLSVCNLIAVNMYGPYDHFDLEDSHVIPAIIKKIDDAIQNGASEVELWGTGTPTREFLYAEDFADAVILAATKPGITPEFINIGTGSEISISELAGLIAELMEYDGQVIWDTAMPDGQARRCLNVDRAREVLGFVASTPLREGLTKTIDWYRDD